MKVSVAVRPRVACGGLDVDPAIWRAVSWLQTPNFCFVPLSHMPNDEPSPPCAPRLCIAQPLPFVPGQTHGSGGAFPCSHRVPVRQPERGCLPDRVLMAGIEDLREKREEVNRSIAKDEEEKGASRRIGPEFRPGCSSVAVRAIKSCAHARSRTHIEVR